MSRYFRPKPRHECLCGRCSWEWLGDYGEEYPVCSNCDTGPYVPGISRVGEHLARKTYLPGTTAEIRPGDRYERTVRRGYWPGGPWDRWTTRRKRLQKGPAWSTVG